MPKDLLKKIQIQRLKAKNRSLFLLVLSVTLLSTILTTHLAFQKNTASLSTPILAQMNLSAELAEEADTATTLSIDLTSSHESSSSELTLDESGDIHLIFTGDIMLGRYIKTLMSQRGGNFPFTYMDGIIEKMAEELEITETSDNSATDNANTAQIKTILDLFNHSGPFDFVVGNLEGPVTDSAYVNPGTAMRFDFEPETAQILKKAGFTTLSLANNHTHDQGADGHTESVQRLQEVGLTPYGHPDTPNGEWSYVIEEIKGKSIGFLGLNDTTVNLDKEAALEKIRVINEETDFLIVSIHWGIEYELTARQSISDFAHLMVDAGADFIHGHHPHVIQNRETYNGVPIYYSLGNFVFDQYWSSATQKGLVVGLTIKEDGGIQVKEFEVDLVDKGAPKVRED
jgi:poly-gamma-glutamate capsule biosynthesis protein CapA/YwtB (metallophosphatase superfamily)